MNQYNRTSCVHFDFSRTNKRRLNILFRCTDGQQKQNFSAVDLLSLSEEAFEKHACTQRLLQENFADEMRELLAFMQAKPIRGLMIRCHLYQWNSICSRVYSQPKKTGVMVEFLFFERDSEAPSPKSLALRIDCKCGIRTTFTDLTLTKLRLRPQLHHHRQLFHAQQKSEDLLRMPSDLTKDILRKDQYVFLPNIDDQRAKVKRSHIVTWCSSCQARGEKI